MFQREVTSAVEPVKRWTHLVSVCALQEFRETYLKRQMMMITRTISNSASSTKPTMIPILAPAITRRRLFTGIFKIGLTKIFYYNFGNHKTEHNRNLYAANCLTIRYEMLF